MKEAFMTLAEATGKRIIELANINGYSLKILSDLAGMSQSTVKNMIYNKTQHPSSTIVYKICLLLNMEMKEFYNSSLFNNIDLKI